MRTNAHRAPVVQTWLSQSFIFPQNPMQNPRKCKKRENKTCWKNHRIQWKSDESSKQSKINRRINENRRKSSEIIEKSSHAPWRLRVPSRFWGPPRLSCDCILWSFSAENDELSPDSCWKTPKVQPFEMLNFRVKIPAARAGVNSKMFRWNMGRNVPRKYPRRAGRGPCVPAREQYFLIISVIFLRKIAEFDPFSWDLVRKCSEKWSEKWRTRPRR